MEAQFVLYYHFVSFSRTNYWHALSVGVGRIGQQRQNPLCQKSMSDAVVFQEPLQRRPGGKFGLAGHAELSSGTQRGEHFPVEGVEVHGRELQYANLDRFFHVFIGDANQVGQRLVRHQDALGPAGRTPSGLADSVV